MFKIYNNGTMIIYKKFKNSFLINKFNQNLNELFILIIIKYIIFHSFYINLYYLNLEIFLGYYSSYSSYFSFLIYKYNYLKNLLFFLILIFLLHFIKYPLFILSLI